MELLRWSTVVRRRRLQIWIFTKFHHDLCAWCPHSNVKIFMKIHSPWHALYFVYWLHKRMTHRYGPHFPSKTAFFDFSPLKISFWKFWKKSKYSKKYEISICFKIRLKHHETTPYPSKWRQGVDFLFWKNHFGMRTSGTSVQETQNLCFFPFLSCQNKHDVRFWRAARTLARVIVKFP